MNHPARRTVVFKRSRIRSISRMRIEKIVGSGTFGVVYKAYDKSKKIDVALKRIKTERELQGFPVTAIREIKILNLMATHSHPNIVRMLEIVTYNGDDDSDEPSIIGKDFSVADIFMVFEFVDFDLSGLLKSSGLKLTERHVKSFLQQLLKGVKYLHSHNILHRDIKSANLLVTRDNVLKIADWGLARCKQTDRKLTNPVVTLWYRSPELILGSRTYGPAVDMWSVGCILGEMATRVAVFRGESELAQLDLIFQVTGSPSGALLNSFKLLPDWDKLSSGKTHLPRLSGRFPHVKDHAFFALMAQLLDNNPLTRITAGAALETDYLKCGEDFLQPDLLPKFTVEPVTEYLAQEQIKRDNDLHRAGQGRGGQPIQHQQTATGRGIGSTGSWTQHQPVGANSHVTNRPDAVSATRGIALVDSLTSGPPNTKRQRLIN